MIILARETEENYSVGEVLSIRLCNELEHCAEIKGLVCNRIATDDGYRIGIHFEYENDQTASDAMLLLEGEVMGVSFLAAYSETEFKKLST